jgi:branched-chain amino acid transport system ATP-binding protein
VTATGVARRSGDVILSLDNISLSFGGVKALTDISFDVREHEIRAIIGPNGAGKSSMLNVINGVYHPQQGTITYRGAVRRDMDTYDAAASGIARTFQNIALFRGMSVLDNIMTGPQPQDEVRLPRAGDLARAREARGDGEPAQGGGGHRLPRDPAHPQDAGRPPAVRLAEARRARARARAEPSMLLLDEPMAGMNVEEKAGHVPLRARRQRAVRHDDRADRARHGRGDGHLRPRRRARLRQEDRRRPPDEIRANKAVIDAYLGVAH